MPDLDIPDDGFVTVRLAGVEQTVDLYSTHNSLIGIRDRFGDDLTAEQVVEYHTAVVEYLMTLNYPRVSTAAAVKFVDAVRGAVRATQGNEPAGPTPGSPASTEPQPSSSPEE